MMAGNAIAAAATRDMVGNEDPLPGSKALYALSHARDLARDLMPQDKRGLLHAVPFHEIAAADAAGLDAHEQLAGADRGHRHLLQAHVAVVIVHRHSHICLLDKLPR